MLYRELNPIAKDMKTYCHQFEIRLVWTNFVVMSIIPQGRHEGHTRCKKKIKPVMQKSNPRMEKKTRHKTNAIPSWSLATLFGPPAARIGQKGSPQKTLLTRTALLLYYCHSYYCHYWCYFYDYREWNPARQGATATLFGPRGTVKKGLYRAP